MSIRAALLVVAALLLAACAPRILPMMPGGGMWGGGYGGSFASNGERIYFTASNEQGQRIAYRGGATFGGGMGMMGAQITCASCHGPDGRGGVHTMHMQMMDAPDIRWSALAGEDEEHTAGDEHADEHAETHTGYDLETFRLAVVTGQHPNGDSLSLDMPRWSLGDDDLADLADYLKSLP